MSRESVPLILKKSNSGLSLPFATLCIIDIFGVLPIIVLPRAIVQCGLYSIPLVLVIFGLQIYTAALLGKSWIIANALDPYISQKNRYPLAAVTELTLGPRARSIVTILLDLTVFGCGVPNLLVASQNLQLFGLKVSNNEFDFSFCYWLLVIGILLCPLMWLGSPQDMKWVATLSSLVVGLIAALVWWSIITDDRTLNVLPVPTSPTWTKLISGLFIYIRYGIIAFQFDIHPTLMTIQVDMKHPENINKAVIFSFLASGTLSGITTGLTVWKYGGSTTANLLQLVSPTIIIRAAILLAALQLCLSSAVGYSPLFQHLENRWSIQRSFGWKRCAIRSAVVFLTIVVGEFVPRFDIVMALIGGSLTGPLVFVLPPLMYIRAQVLKKNIGNRASNFNMLSNMQEHSEYETSFQSKIHAQPTHQDFSKDYVDSYRYSYANYDDVCDPECFSKNVLQFTQKKLDGYPVLVEACRFTPHRKRNVSVKTFLNLGSYCNFQLIFDWFSYSVAILGIIITLSSTYINIKNTIKFVNFTSPCIFNVTSVSLL